MKQKLLLPRFNKLVQWLNNPVLALQGYQASQQVLSLAFSILLAKVLRDTAQIGFFEMLIFLAFLLTYFWVTGVSQSFMRSTDAKDPERYGKWLFTYLFMMALITILFGSLYLGRATFLPVLVGQVQVPYLAEYMVYLIFSIPTIALPLLWVLEHKAWYIWIFAVGSWALKFGAVAIPLLLGWGLEAGIRWLIVVGAVMQLPLLFTAWQRRSHLKKWWWFKLIGQGSLPLILYTLIGALAMAIDSVLIGRFYGDERIFAIFRYGSKELPFVGALVGALIQSVLPLYYRQEDLGNQALRKGSLKLIHVLFPLCILLVWINPWLFPRLFTESFRESAFLFNIYLITLIPRLWLIHTLFIARHQHRAMVMISASELLINVLVSILAMQWMGMFGVAVGTVVAYMYEKVVMSVVMRKQGVPMRSIIPVGLFGGYSVLLITSVVAVWMLWHG